MSKLKRIKEIKVILDNDFGADSSERVEDLLDELDELTTRRCPLCNELAVKDFRPYCSEDCQTHDNLLC
jgi:hypothetical protein